MYKEKRITLTVLNPNPLFTKWLSEWLEYATRKNSLKKYSLTKALESMGKYPLVMHSGRDCSILDGFGSNICRMLDRKLEQHRLENQVLTELEHDQSMKDILKIAQKRIVASIPLAEPPSQQQVSTPKSRMIPRGCFEIILLVDTQETAGKSKRLLDATVLELQKHNIKFEVRRLSVGDFLWVCRESAFSTVDNEHILPYVVERKRMDDFAGSIRDGRFKEQKFRLQESGVTNLVYLIESRGGNQNLGLPLQTLLQAATNTQVQNGFTVKFTDSHQDSMLYLAVMTKLLIELYKTKDLTVGSIGQAIPLPVVEIDRNDSAVTVYNFKEFSTKTAKMRNFCISDLFLRQLLQLRSLSLDKALAIVQRFPTPANLLEAYARCTQQSVAELLLAKIEYGKLKRTIGPVISKCIYHLYHSQQLT